MEDVKRIVIEHGGTQTELEVDISSTVQIIKFQVFSLTDIPPDEQKLVGIEMAQDDDILASVGVSDGTVISVVQVEDARQEMMSRIASNAQHVLLYEDVRTQQQARDVIPVSRLEEAATKAAGPGASPAVVRDKLHEQLLSWYKHEFFSWVNNPPCSACKSDNTECIGTTAPTPIEMVGMAGIVEVYQCGQCGSHTRFPRFNHPSALLRTRQGRCGEFANCFTLLCRAMGFEARHVHDWTDHVWTEVYSEAEQRWVHCDPCEDTRDSPLMYESGWGKELTYVIANSKDECVDVTQRYSKQWKEVCCRRTKCPEYWLADAVRQVDLQARGRLQPGRQAVIVERRVREEAEFAANKAGVDWRGDAPQSAAAQSAEARGRQSGSLMWRLSRGETGRCASDGQHNDGTQDDQSAAVAPPPGWFTAVFQPNFSGSSDTKLVRDASKHDTVVQLTQGHQDQVGAAWHPRVLPVGRGFECFFQFSINGVADGMAFVIQADRVDASGDAGGGKGFQGIRRCVAVEFDIYGECSQGRVDHISVQSRGHEPNSADKAHSLGDTGVVKLEDGRPHAVKVAYDSKDKMLRVFMDRFDEPALQVGMDLTSTIGGNAAWLGFTAATGGLAATHSVHAWAINMPSEHLPCRAAVNYRTVNVGGMLKKVQEFNTTATQTLAPDAMGEVERLAHTSSAGESVELTPLGDKALHTMLGWEPANRFPALDLLRMLVLDKGVSARVAEAGIAGDDFTTAVLLAGGLGQEGPKSSRLTAIRALANGLSSAALAPTIARRASELLAACESLTECQDVTLCGLYASVLINLSLVGLDPADLATCTKCARALVITLGNTLNDKAKQGEISAAELDKYAETSYRALVALGTAMCSARKEAAPAVGDLEIQAKDLHLSTFVERFAVAKPKVAEATYEIEGLLRSQQ